MNASSPAWRRALAAAALFAVDPAGCGGVHVRASAGPVRERWLAIVRMLLPPAMPLRRVPLAIDDARLLGGLDLGATLQAGRPVAERGLLAQGHGGVLVLAMAERLSAGAAARFTAALDDRAVVTARHGITLRTPSRFGVIALDEGRSDDERVPAGLLDRLALRVELDGIAWHEVADEEPGRADAARDLVPAVRVRDADVDAVCRAAAALGVDSARAPLFALHLARCAAALDDRLDVQDDDVALAAQLVLAPRATRVPAPADAEPPPERPPPDADAPEPPPSVDDAKRDDAVRALEDIVLAAAAAALPAGLLARLAADTASASAATSGRAGGWRKSRLRGRPAGVVRGDPRAGARLDVLATLRAAAPWQRLRANGAGGARVQVRKEDFHVTRHRERAETTTVFVVDASGSSALHRLAEAKGAVERLLAECYVRRDRVAVVAFRGERAEVVLPPTRSLVRARRRLAGLPGGGGTPLAAGLDAAAEIAEGVLRRGGTPTVVLLTDGRANVARDGTHGRDGARRDAEGAARRLRARRVASVLIDTSPRPQPLAERLADDLGARYVALPYADARSLAEALLKAPATER